jgi:hypothetical protein
MKNDYFGVITTQYNSFVIDKNTNKVIKQFNKKRDAQKCANFLNSGGAFNGSIPEYMFNGWSDRPRIAGQ